MMTPAPTFRSRLWRWTKRLSLVATLLVVAAVPAGAFGIPLASRTSWARARMEKKLTRAIGVPVAIGSMSWSWKEGLRLEHVSTATTSEQTSFRIDRIQLRPRLSHVAQGKLRVRAIVERPQFTISESGPALRLPLFPKKGIRLERLDLVNGSIAVKNGNETAEVRDLTVHASGRVEQRVLKIDVASASGTCEGASFYGDGVLRLSQEGLSGQIGLKDAATKESAALQKVLRALHLTPPKAPVLSEPF